MANIPSIAKKIQNEEAQERSASSESLMQKIGGSINWLIDNAQGMAVGSVDGSFLNETQYQAINGIGYVLADGRPVPGTLYASITGQSNIPDLRGQYLRGKDLGAGVNPSGDLPLPSVSISGSIQVAGMASHNHIAYVSPLAGVDRNRVGVFNPALVCSSGLGAGETTGAASTIVVAIGISGTGVGEPIHVRLNWFIRVD